MHIINVIILKRAIVIIVLVVGFFMLQTFYRAGQFRSINNSIKGEVIQTYSSMPGPEDMQVDHRSGKLFISSTERRTDDKADNAMLLPTHVCSQTMKCK